MTKVVNEREMVLDILTEVLENGKFSHYIIRDYLNKVKDSDKKMRSFITRLAEGTIEKKLEMDYIIDSFSKIKVEKMKPTIRNILRMSVYQLKYMDRVPDSAVCNEAVKLAGKRGLKS